MTTGKAMLGAIRQQINLSDYRKKHWEGTFEEYLDVLDSQPLALDIGTQVPHAALRSYAMGARARDDATADDIAQMAEAL